jgi:hypothetical protein
MEILGFSGKQKFRIVYGKASVRESQKKNE